MNQDYGKQGKPITAKQLKMVQRRPFQVRIPDAYKKYLFEDSIKTGVHRGIFFDTSGKVHCEQINPNAQYQYLFRTDMAMADKLMNDCPVCGMPCRWVNEATASSPDRMCDACEDNAAKAGM